MIVYAVREFLLAISNCILGLVLVRQVSEVMCVVEAVDVAALEAAVFA